MTCDLSSKSYQNNRKAVRLCAMKTRLHFDRIPPVGVCVWGGGGGGRVVRRCCVNFQCWDVLLIWIIEGQEPFVLAVGAGGGCLDIFFSHLSLLFSFSLSLADGLI